MYDPNSRLEVSPHFLMDGELGPAELLEERKAATQRYLDQLRKVVMNEPDRRHPNKETN